MFAELVEEIRLEATRPKEQRVSRKKANRYAAQFRTHSDPHLQKVSREDAKEMARKAKDRENKLAPQFVHGMRKDAGSKAQSPERQAKYRARVKYDWQTEARSKTQKYAGEIKRAWPGVRDSRAMAIGKERAKNLKKQRPRFWQRRTTEPEDIKTEPEVHVRMDRDRAQARGWVESRSKGQQLAGLAASGGGMKKWQAKAKAADMEKWSPSQRARQKQVWRQNAQDADSDRLATKQAIATGKLHRDDPKFAKAAMRHLIRRGVSK